MRNTFFTFLLLFSGFLTTPVLLQAQCSPADSTICADTTGKGKVCPDTLKTAYLNQPYHQVVTMVIPTRYDTGIYTIALHHLQLMKVTGLPPEIQWKSNAKDNIFMAGKRYCVDFSGIPDTTGHFPLKIYIDIYSSYNGVAIRLGQTVDSTSLWIDVLRASSIRLHHKTENQFRAWPNPFRHHLFLSFSSLQPGTARLDIFNLLGQRLYQKEVPVVKGKNTIPVDVERLPSKAGTLLIRLQQGTRVMTALVNRQH